LQAWQSGANFPTGYVTRSDMNALAGLCRTATPACTASVGSKNLAGATDGDTTLSTSASVGVGPAGQAWLRLELPGGPLPLRRVSVRPLVAAAALLRVELLTAGGGSILAGTLNSTASYSWAQLLGPWQVSPALEAAACKISPCAWCNPCFEVDRSGAGQPGQCSARLPSITFASSHPRWDDLNSQLALQPPGSHYLVCLVALLTSSR
jgi:hypothetical protein